jgi:uncharacterized protein (TIGR03086 family)
MGEIADRYRTLSDAFTGKVAGVAPDQWDAPTPCEDWTVRDLVRHVVDTQGMFLGFVGRTVGESPAFDDDPLACWTVARDAVQADLDDPDRAAAEYEGQLGTSTFEKAVDGFLCFDQVVHGWDLAHATGQDERIAPDEVRRIIADTEAFGEMLRSPGACKPALEAPADADEQTKMLMALGRTP